MSQKSYCQALMSVSVTSGVGILPKSHKLSRLLSPATMSTWKLLSSINIYAFPSLIVQNVYFFFLIKKPEIWWWWPSSISSLHFYSHADEVYFYFLAWAYWSSPAASQWLPIFVPLWSFSVRYYGNSFISCSRDWNPLLLSLIFRPNKKQTFYLMLMFLSTTLKASSPHYLAVQYF